MAQDALIASGMAEWDLGIGPLNRFKPRNRKHYVHHVYMSRAARLQLCTLGEWENMAQGSAAAFTEQMAQRDRDCEFVQGFLRILQGKPAEPGKLTRPALNKHLLWAVVKYPSSYWPPL